MRNFYFKIRNLTITIYGIYSTMLLNHYQLLYILNCYILLLYIFSSKNFSSLHLINDKKILAILNRRAKSHCAPFHFGVYPLAFARNIAKSSAAAWENGSGERRIRTESARVRSLKPSQGDAKHVTVLKESGRSVQRATHKACPICCKTRAHVPSNLLFRYSLVGVSSTGAAPVFWIILVHI